ncbi:hypothetical protein P168DRAFT_328252 [Aspergillus campestris IBT 28561]|uniref:BZIP domain-containing protein n=1 Tax=Aspergillus campestris (strain IBT 28561) TaxID=1392248 RepID=A0A2I1CZY6_ASPC2|nr:uncharacterized protein P168DRAFT_328252 [Aspergillus campestris IBT 28561]PKY03188.1 hypothetical protein P168DRAFT_328252 [Aspergillus campestris IBT 28561]
MEAADAIDDPINPTDKEKIRRARKRATDRQSQRDHRERQRIYIRQLEETVQSYKDAFSSNGSSDLAALLKEQERLQARCKSLEAALARIKKLASDVHVGDDVGCTDQDPQNLFARNPQQASVSTSPSAELDSSGPSDGLPHVGQPVSGTRAMDMSIGLPSHEMDYFDLSCDRTPVFNTTMPLIHQEDRVEELRAGDDLDRCIASMVDGTATDPSLVPDSIAMRTPLLTEPVIPIDFNGALPTHPSFPKLSHSMGKWDEILLSMVDEARLQHRRGQFGMNEPSLRSLLGDLIGSTDVFAMIEHQAQRMETWKVDRRFQEKYSQFADCRLG